MGLWEQINRERPTPSTQKIVEQSDKLRKQKEELAKKMKSKGYSPSGQYHDPKFYTRINIK